AQNPKSGDSGPKRQSDSGSGQGKQSSPSGNGRQPDSPPPPGGSLLSGLANWAATILKWLLLAAVIIAAIYWARNNWDLVVESWARERGCPRPQQQTPHEFGQEVARREAGIATEAVAVAELYGRVAYAKDSPAQGARQHLERLWQKLMQGPGAA